jgi:tetratricopeptide (TPR) repeat protein
LEEATLTLAELLAEAAAAASLGDRDEAERLYRRATERSPGNSAAWLGLAAALVSPEEKRACYEQVLAINPNNGEARVALQRLASLAAPEQASAIQATLSNAAAMVAADPTRYAPATSLSPDNGAGDDHAHSPAAGNQVLFCANHPETETTLRCNRCGKPVCVKCVELTEVGYRCKECIRAQQNVFFTAETKDYFVLAIVSFVLAALATPIIELLLGMLGLFFGVILAVFLGPAVGGAAATIIRRSVGRRRGRYMGAVGVAAIILGVGFGLLVASVFNLGVNLIPLAVFLFLSLSTIYATLR